MDGRHRWGKGVDDTRSLLLLTTALSFRLLLLAFAADAWSRRSTSYHTTVLRSPSRHLIPWTTSTIHDTRQPTSCGLAQLEDSFLKLSRCSPAAVSSASLPRPAVDVAMLACSLLSRPLAVFVRGREGYGTELIGWLAVVAVDNANGSKRTIDCMLSSCTSVVNVQESFLYAWSVDTFDGASRRSDALTILRVGQDVALFMRRRRVFYSHVRGRTPAQPEIRRSTPCT